MACFLATTPPKFYMALGSVKSLAKCVFHARFSTLQLRDCCIAYFLNSMTEHEGAVLLDSLPRCDAALTEL